MEIKSIYKFSGMGRSAVYIIATSLDAALEIWREVTDIDEPTTFQLIANEIEREGFFE